MRLDEQITKITGRQESGITLGLTRITKLLNELQNPHLKIKNIIHIAGTNGKFSTLCHIKSVLEEAGYSCNSFISPHLIKFNERINLAGQDIDSDFARDLIRYIAKKNNDLATSYFEFITALAFMAFDQRPADFLLLETGLGGRLDATNVIQEPLISIITKIGYDHKKFLGSDIANIAVEKAGIIKPNCSVFSDAQLPQVNQVLINKSKQVFANFFQKGCDWKIDKKEFGYSISSRFDDDCYINLSDNYSYQSENRGLAYGVCKYLKSDEFRNKYGYNFDISSSNIETGFNACKVVGRLQKFFINGNNSSNSKSSKQNEETQILLDGAHNPLAAKALLEFISNYSKKNYHISLVCGFLITKDWQEFLSIISSVSDAIYLVRLLASPIPFVSTEEMSDYLSKMKVAHKSLTQIDDFGASDLESLVTEVQTSTSPKKNLIIICGSLHLVAQIIRTSNKHNFIKKWKKSTVDY